MNEVRHVLVGVLLAAAVAVQWLCCLGVLRMRGAYNRLHFLGPASLLGPGLIAGAVLVDGASAEGSVKAVLLAVILLTMGPVVSHALARAARVRETGSTAATAAEIERGTRAP